MGAERAIRRYRGWYVRLLRLYPRRYHERFGDSMAQTFTDLCRERSDSHRPLLAFVLWMFAETSAGIIKENLVAEHPVQAERPIGITLLAILALIGAPILLFAARIWIVIERVGGLPLAIAVATLLLAPLYLVFAFAAWTLKPWGWALGVVVGAGTVVTMVLMLFNEMTNLIDEAPMLEIIAGGIIAVALVGLLLLRKSDVQAAFGRA
ncbi:MAG TPA: hypothetical protein VD763_01955 [Candidatus Saccharimonadales bacterium]|nr:hypothetical protein [Candidatus Saccharimonadales bacterium]